MTTFCVKCKQKITVDMAAMFAESKPVEFEDGFYCANCAKIKVQEARR